MVVPLAMAVIGAIVIGVLVGGSSRVGEYPGFTGESTAAVIASCNADAKSVETAVEAYHAQVGKYPPTLDVLTQTARLDGQALGPWLKEVPSSTHYTILVSPGGSVYVYPPNSAGAESLSPEHNYEGTSNPCDKYAS